MSSYTFILKRAFFFLCFSIVILMGVSEDSYIHEMFGQCDSAAFFTCGKAWVEGLIPYVDFADGKGPFLWLIYGMGYLISSTDYTGVYWLSCINYAFVFYFTYLIASVFLKDDKYSIIASLLMSFAFFNPLRHNEVRAEDFALLYVSISLYIMCRILYDDEYDHNHIGQDAFVLGICFGLCLLIKFSFSIMLGIFAVYYLYWAIRNKQPIFIVILKYCLGIVISCLPFMLYFLIKGNFWDFINEYFINTMFTVNPGGQSTKNAVVRLFIWNFSNLLMGIISALIPIWLGIIKRDRYFLLISVLFFFLIISPNAQMGYYFNICSIFAVFLVICLLYLLKHANLKINRLTLWVASLVILFSCVMVHLQLYHFTTKHSHTLKIQSSDNASRTIYHYYTNIIKRKDKATIMYWGGLDVGLGAPGRSIPACKYWILQNGATESMIKGQREAIESRTADFVIIDRDDEEKETVLENLHYQKHDSQVSGDHLLLFSKQSL